MRYSAFIFAIAMAVVLSGCASPTSPTLFNSGSGSLDRQASGQKSFEQYTPGGYAQDIRQGSERFRMTHDSGPSSSHSDEAHLFLNEINALAKRIVAHLRHAGRTGEGLVLLPSTFVNLDDLDSTSSFGRLCAEELATALKGQRFEVLELRRAVDVMIEPGGGELMLSRQSEELYQTYPANTLILGTYTVTAQHIVLSVRLVKAGDNRLASAGTAIFDRNNNLFLNSLLLNQKRSARSDGRGTNRLRTVRVRVSTRFNKGKVREEDLTQ